MASAGGEIENYHLPVGSLSSESFSITRPVGALRCGAGEEKRLTNRGERREERFLTFPVLISPAAVSRARHYQLSLELNLSVISHYQGN